MNTRSTTRRPAPRPPAGQRRGVDSAPARFDQRRQAAGRARWRGIATLLMVLAVVGGLWWLLGFSSVFAARSVEVSGVNNAQSAAIAKVAQDSLGKPLMTVDTDAISSAIAEMPPVKVVTVGRSWPSTISIEITPRTPAVVLKNSKGQLEVIDDDGVAFGVVNAAPKGVPLIAFTGAEQITGDAVKTALAAIKALPDDLSKQLTAVSVSASDLVTFTMGRTTVVWGGADQAQKKVEITRALLKTGPTFLDVSAPTTPVTRAK